jgi:hypothetical protein
MSMSTTTATTNSAARICGILAMVGGVILIVAGVAVWFVVTDQLSAQKITVSGDADCAAGKTVDGPISAYCQAEVINKHALAATGGKTYAELDKEDPTRTTAMQASFLQASLFTSVIAYGVCAMAAGLGILFVLTGWALTSLSKPQM